MKRSNIPVAAVVIPALASSVVMVCALGCSGRVAGSDPPGPAASSGSSQGSPCGSGAGATIQSPGPPPSTCSTTGRVICTLPAGVTLSVPPADGGAFTPPVPQQSADLSSQPVTVGVGTGVPPAPLGGAVTPGEYQLVAATVYGPIPPNVVGPFSPGEVTGATLNVSCDVYNIVYGTTSDGAAGTLGGNGCGRLVPFSIPLTALVGFADAGDIWGDWMPYSASPGKLTLIDTEPYKDLGLGLTEGSYTVVEEFASMNGTMAGSAADDSVSASGCSSSPPAPAAARDPRCPASPPANSATCDPSSGPLECEYGGDALGRCTTLASCALQPDGSYQFVVQPAANEATCTNPPACPSTYATAIEVDASAVLGQCPDGGAGVGLCGPGESVACDYPEGVCSCAIEGMASNFGCTARAASGDCPATRPLSGDGCPSAGLQCYYGDPCGGVYEGMPLVCVGGYWETFNALYSCPAFPATICPAGTVAP